MVKSIHLHNNPHTEQPAAGLDSWVGKAQVAKMLGVSVRSVERLVATGQLPRPVRLGRLLRWKLSTIQKHLEQLEHKAQAGR
jgi:excisionase family DNA binding protein